MKQPKPENKERRNRFLRPETHRSGAFVLALVGSLFVWFGFGSQSILALVGVLLMFVGAILSLVAVVLALRLRSPDAVISALILLMWNVLFPLIMMSRQLALFGAA